MTKAILYADNTVEPVLGELPVLSPLSIKGECFGIIAAQITNPDIIFHPGPNETRFTAAGMIYRGELVEDAGAAHALLMDILNGKPLPPPAADTSPFPDRDPDQPAEQQGLFRKFDVRRTDGSDAPGGKHHGCRYFVIDLDHDQHAGPAMRAYAAACSPTHPALAADLIAQFGAVPDQAAREKVLQAEVTRLTALAKQHNADAEMYARAWQRELAGFLRPKGHHIDMLVVSTRYLAERCRKAEREVSKLTGASADCGARIGESASFADTHQRALYDAMNLVAAKDTALPPLAFVIDQLEAADAPDSRLDCLIALIVGCNAAPVPRYTASFDEALKLIEPGRDYELTSYGSGPDGKTFTCVGMKWWPRPDDKSGWRAESGNKLSPALALCIAALKVQLARAEEVDGGVKRSVAG